MDANPLLFDGNLDRKPAFDAVVMAAKGEPFEMTVADTLPEAGDLLIDFEPYVADGKVKNVELREAGILGRGTGHQAVLKIAQKINHTEGAAIGFALQVSRNEQDAGMMFDVSRYAGKTITVTMHVMTEDRTIRMGLDTGSDTILAEADSAAEWTPLSAACTIPEDVKAAHIYIETDGAADFYVDDIEVLCGEVSSEAVPEEETQDSVSAGAERDTHNQEKVLEEPQKKGNMATAAVVAAVVLCGVAGIVLLRKRK